MMSNLKEKLKEKVIAILNTQLPPALSILKFKRLLIGFIVIAFSVAAAIVLRNPSLLLGIVLALFMIIVAFKLNYDYALGHIQEHDFICISAIMKSKNMDVTFKDKNKRTYVFNYICRNQVFYEDMRYLVYVNKSNGRNIIAYQEL